MSSTIVTFADLDQSEQAITEPAQPLKVQPVTDYIRNEKRVFRKIGKDGRERVYTFNKVVEVVSDGAGVDSTAMILKLWEKGHRFIVVHCDVGAETKTTPAVVAWHKAWCEARGIEFIVIKRGDFCEDKRPIDQYHIDKHIIPSKARRDCTDKFKIQPKRKYLRARFGKDVLFRNYIGYNADEVSRVNKQKKKVAENGPDVLYEECVYPMVDLYPLTRQQEKDYIASQGLPVPEKSGCYFCPYISEQGWKITYFKNRDEFAKARFIEENSGEYAKSLAGYYPKGRKVLLGGKKTLAQIEEECKKMTPEEVKKLLESGIERCLATGF